MSLGCCCSGIGGWRGAWRFLRSTLHTQDARFSQNTVSTVDSALRAPLDVHKLDTRHQHAHMLQQHSAWLWENRVRSRATPAPGRRETATAARCLGQRWGTPGGGWRQAPLRTATAALEQPRKPAWQTAAGPAVLRTAPFSHHCSSAQECILHDDQRAKPWQPLRTRQSVQLPHFSHEQFSPPVMSICFY